MLVFHCSTGGIGIQDRHGKCRLLSLLIWCFWYGRSKVQVAMHLANRDWSRFLIDQLCGVSRLILVFDV